MDRSSYGTAIQSSSEMSENAADSIPRIRKPPGTAKHFRPRPQARVSLKKPDEIISEMSGFTFRVPAVL